LQSHAFFTSERKRISVRTLHIHCLISVKFGTTDLNIGLMLLSICQFRENMSQTIWGFTY